MKNFHKHFFICLLVLSSALFFQKESLATDYGINHPLQGTQVSPPTNSPGLGVITGTYNDVTRILTFELTFAGLANPTSGAHFHAPAPRGGNAPTVISLVPDGFPVGVTSGFFSHSYMLSVSQNLQILDGLWYVDIHVTAFQFVEIRGQLDGLGTLPVELSSFTSVILRNTVTLNWATVSETNNSGFDIERRLVNSEWTRIGNVQGHVTVTTPQNYIFTDRGLASGKYNYRLKQIDFNGNFEYFNLSNEVGIGIPTKYDLSQNYPNPFNPTTNINYDIPFDGKVSIKIFDVSGRVVTTLVNEVQPAGYYTINFSGSNLSSGAYFYRISADGNGQNFAATKKMMLVK